MTDGAEAPVGIQPRRGGLAVYWRIGILVGLGLIVGIGSYFQFRSDRYELIEYSVAGTSTAPETPITLEMGSGRLTIQAASDEIGSDFELVDGQLVIRDTLFRGPDDDLESANGVINYVLIRARNGEEVGVTEAGGVMTWNTGGVVLVWELQGAFD